jgi:hypothetical protein
VEPPEADALAPIIPRLNEPEKAAAISFSEEEEDVKSWKLSE